MSVYQRQFAFPNTDEAALFPLTLHYIDNIDSDSIIQPVTSRMF